MPDGWTRRLRFDLDNQLVAAWATGPNAPEDRFGFAYDLSGERVLKYRVTDGSVIEATFSLRDQEGNVLTDFLWTPTAIGSATGNWHRLSDHVFLGRRPLVHRTCPNSGQVTYTTVVTDHLQSTRKEISNLDNPAAQSTFTYWPFGEFAERLGSPTSKHLYTAHEREDTGTEHGTMAGLDYMHARYYSQGSGRFLTIDPGGALSSTSGQSWNRYVMANNNAVLYIDPDGQAPRLTINHVFIQRMLDFNRAARLKLNMALAKLGPAGEAVSAVADFLISDFAPENREELLDSANTRLAGVGVPAVAFGPKGEPLLKLTRGNLRKNLARITEAIPEESHAHHIFSVKFEVAFKKAGLDIHNPVFATWWEKASHLRNAAQYNSDWERFFRRSRSPDEIRQFGRELAKKYGIEVFF